MSMDPEHDRAESEDAARRSEPAYTIVGTYGEGGNPYVVTVYTYNGPEAALTLAHEAYARRVSAHSGELDPPELEVVAMFVGELTRIAYPMRRFTYTASVSVNAASRREADAMAAELCAATERMDTGTVSIEDSEPEEEAI